MCEPVGFARLLAIVLVTSVGSSGCLRSMAIGAAADALSASGGTFASDDDPALVEDAAPFALKTMEGLLVERPDHLGLLTALAAGFTQYGYVFVKEEADRLEDIDIDRSIALRGRALRLFARARGYALRALSENKPDFEQSLKENVEEAVSGFEREDVPALYWLAASSGLRVAMAKDDPAVFADFPSALSIARRALELDEAWGDGAIHDLLIAFESGFPGGSLERARQHFDRSVALSGGRRAGTYLGLAEGVAVKTQDAREFLRLIDLALAIDPDAHPADRLANVVMQRRARRLKAKVSDLFLEDPKEEGRARETMDSSKASSCSQSAECSESTEASLASETREAKEVRGASGAFEASGQSRIKTGQSRIRR